MSITLYPKCPECGRKTTLKYKVDIIVKGSSQCTSCKAILIPMISENWLFKSVLAISFGYIAHVLSEFFYPSGAPVIRALMIFFSAIIAINIIDIFSGAKAFRS